MSSGHVTLPTVSYRLVEDRATQLPAGVHSGESRSYGYNDFSDFERPDYYIRHIEPIESELAKQVEYDMDEQDQEWLDNVNVERRKDQSGAISYEAFEIIMDKLEKEWFDLIKRVPQPASHMPVEDSMCAICDDGEGENSNAIVFCDGCNLAVHQDCYGVPYIPEGQWLCRKCTVSPENPVSCLFCPNEGGAFKQTSTGHWAHLLCAIWIPEVGVGNTVYMEPVEGVSDVPKNRWKLVCSICKTRKGACVQCDNRSCFTAFHVSCARQEGLLMSMKSVSTDGVLRAFCERHLPPDAPRKKRDDAASDGGAVTTTTKSARAHTKSYRPGPPLVPAIIVNKLGEYVSKMPIRKKMPFIERLCRYWSLKREARRGAPLLKRLHLEPWTASNAQKEDSEEDRAMKHGFLVRLRTDLEKVRMLAELVRKREREKLRQAQCIKDIVDDFVFPHFNRLQLILEKISAMDKTELFLNPVTRADAPDYFDVIKEPMCWLAIDEKLEKHLYRNTAEFKRDILLVLDNAMTYNVADSLFHRIAARIKKNAEPLLAELDVLAPQQAEQVAGDLEPRAETLEMLLKSTDDPQIDVLASLFAFTLEPPRPPTPPPTPPPPPPEKKVQKPRASNAERREKWAAKLAEPRISARATRATEAVAKAFETEAGVTADSSEQAESSTMAEKAARTSKKRARNVKAADDDQVSAASSVVGQIRPARPERGVVGVRTLAHLTEGERRQMERDMELSVDQLNAEDIFKRFNVGWVLPEGSRRGGRPERSEVPATKKRARKASDVSGSLKSSQLAGPSTQRLPKSSRSDSSLSPISSDAEDVIEVETEQPAENLPSMTPAMSSTYSSAPTPVQESVQAQEPQQAILSNTAPRRGEGTSSRNQRPRRSHVAEILEPPTKRLRTSTSQLADTPAASPAKRAAKGKSKAEAAPTQDMYPVGTLVWAKVPSFPFFPAEVVDPTDDEAEIPDSLLNLYKDSAAGDRHWVIRFFDSKDTFGCVSADNLDFLGESNDTDEGYLAGRIKNGTKKGFRSSHLKTACRKAYHQALSQMAIDGEEEEEAVEESK